MDSVPPETPIRDVVDRCRVWESHADPAVRRVGKPSPDPMYPAYAVGDADNNIETTRVATVTGLRSSPNQLEDLLRRVLTPATVFPRQMTIGDVSHAVEQSVGGGGLSWFPPGFRQCGSKRLWLGSLLDGSVLMMMLEYDRT